MRALSYMIALILVLTGLRWQARPIATCRESAPSAIADLLF
jgi:hypothetical protein